MFAAVHKPLGVILFDSPVGISASSRTGLTTSSILRYPVNDLSLNTSLKAFVIVVSAAGFEPRIPGSRVKCANHYTTATRSIVYM